MPPPYNTQINALMPVAARSDAAGAAPPGPLTVPGPDGWSFSSANRIPNQAPPGTYTGAIPTPPTDFATQQFPYQTGQQTHEYHQMLQLLQQQGVPPAQLNQLLQMLYMRGRT
jgi:hypothetical protein